MIDNFFKRLLQSPEAHARLVNSLSFIEYIGARKIFKGPRAEHFSLELLSHAAEEIRHAQMLKRLALRLSDGVLTSYRPEHLLAGESAEHYIQAIDHAAEKLLGEKQAWKNYLLTTLIVEERADSFYKEYEEILAPLGHGGIVSAIVKEEVGHLKKMQEWLKKEADVDDAMLSKLRNIETTEFEAFLSDCLSDISPRS